MTRATRASACARWHTHAFQKGVGKEILRLPSGGDPQPSGAESAGEHACARARRRRPAPPSAEGGLAHSSGLPAPPQARRLGVVDSRPAERDGERFPEQRKKADVARKKEKPVEQGEERGSRAGAVARHASLPHTPRGCGSPPETGAAPKRPVDYDSQKAVRWRAYDSRQAPRARLSSVRCFLGRNYSSHEASREAAWKWAAWKSLGPLKLAASLVSRAVLNAAVEEPARRVTGTPRYVAPGAGATSGKGGGDLVAVRTPRVSAGEVTRRTAGCGHRLWGAAAPGLTPSVPGGTRVRMAQLSSRATRLGVEELGVRETWVHVPALPLWSCGLGKPRRTSFLP